MNRILLLYIVFFLSGCHTNDYMHRNLMPIQSEQHFSEARIALVIGNGKYEQAPLSNPLNDAKAIGNALAAVGFEVDLHLNLKQESMKRAIDSFDKELQQGGVGLFYFAGHGVQVDGENYLIPADAKIAVKEDVEYEAVNVGRVLAKMKAANNRVNIVILDACRNNPFGAIRSSYGSGLAAINAPSGTFISYSTAPGRVSVDGKGRNSPFSAELFLQMGKPCLRIEDVFKQVRVAVKRETNERQVPWESSSLIGDFYFRPCENGLQPSSDWRSMVRAYEIERRLDEIERLRPNRAPSPLYVVVGLAMVTYGTIELATLPATQSDDFDISDEEKRGWQWFRGLTSTGLGSASVVHYFSQRREKGKLRKERQALQDELTAIGLMTETSKK